MNKFMRVMDKYTAREWQRSSCSMFQQSDQLPTVNSRSCPESQWKSYWCFFCRFSWVEINYLSVLLKNFKALSCFTCLLLWETSWCYKLLLDHFITVNSECVFLVAVILIQDFVWWKLNLAKEGWIPVHHSDHCGKSNLWLLVITVASLISDYLFQILGQNKTDPKRGRI